MIYSFISNFKLFSLRAHSKFYDLIFVFYDILLLGMDLKTIILRVSCLKQASEARISYTTILNVKYFMWFLFICLHSYVLDAHLFFISMSNLIGERMFDFQYVSV